MRKLAFILTLLLAALLCQTAAAEAPDVRLFRSLRDVLCGIRLRWPRPDAARSIA